MDTSDGYVVSMFRMPKENRKGIVFLEHAAIGVSGNWVDKGNESLGNNTYNNFHTIMLK